MSNKWRIIYLVLCCIGGGIAAYFGQPYVAENADATLIIITVLTVFAGFLVAMIGIIGDPSLLPGGSWRAAELRRDDIEGRLIRYAWLFALYLVGIAFLFVGSLLHKAPDVTEVVKIWIERLYLFFGVTAFLLTLLLPNSLLKLQRKRVDAEIERRRREAGIPEESDSSETGA